MEVFRERREGVKKNQKTRCYDGGVLAQTPCLSKRHHFMKILCYLACGNLGDIIHQQEPYQGIWNCLEEEGKGLRKTEDTVLYILLTINHLQDISASEITNETMYVQNYVNSNHMYRGGLETSL